MFGFKKYTLKDLEYVKAQIRTDNSKFKIAVIEDKVFPFLEELRRHDFNITIYNDIERINLIADYDIVVSDIKGVGKLLGSKLQGAHLIEEIHKRYPNIYLIAYSASLFNPEYNKYFELCDETKKKGIDVNDWVNTLEKAIKNSNDPIYQWEKSRKMLLKNGVDIGVVSKLERVYVKSIIKKKKGLLMKELSTSKSGLPDSVKIIFDSVAIFAGTLISNILKSD
jgi:hypothetical protein